jgi:hypothetical protein
MPNREVGEHKNGGSTDRLLGELVAEVRAVKHTANGASQKIDAVAGKVDALAIVVANQGHMQEDVNELKDTVKDLVADKLRREGAIGLFDWICRHWPFPVISAALAVWIAWANGKFHL